MGYQADLFQFNLKKYGERARGMVATKHNILSLLACIFDPLGIISPVTVRGKILFQGLCVDKVGWDDELSGERRSEFEKWSSSLKNAGRISVPRCLHEGTKAPDKCSLHGFADASLKAYCAVIYFVSQADGRIHVEMLTSKTRVSPLKRQTIPRMELMAGRVLAQLMHTVKAALQNNIVVTETHLWLDSKTALYWIKNQKEWKQFVRHRVNEVLRLTDKEEWGHCPGKENPADIGSRGVLAAELVESQLWWKGPSWLSRPKEEWPGKEEIVETPEGLEEAKKISVCVVQNINECGIAGVLDVNRYSKLDRLLRVTSLVLRFTSNVRAQRTGSSKTTGEVKTEEIVKAEKMWVKEVQKQLKSKPNFKGLVKELGIVTCGCDGIMKCKGRLGNSELDTEVKEPAILPKDHKFTSLVVERCHERVYHSGVRSTLAELRTRFWVPKGRQVVKRILSRCLVCRKAQGKSCGTPPIAALPDFRVREVPPFSRVGIDFAGPLFVKGVSGEMEKVYIVLFSCCVTRAIHLDLITDMSTTAFIRCLRKFAARRGSPALIVSDNAKTFKSANKVLKKLNDDHEVASHLVKNRIEWRLLEMLFRGSMLEMAMLLRVRVRVSNCTRDIYSG